MDDSGLNTITLRCSQLDRLMACPASVLQPAANPNMTQVEAAHDAAGMGSAVHEALAEWINRETYDAATIMNRHGVQDAETFEMLTFAGIKLWGKLAPHFDHARTEVEASEKLAENATLTGTMDVLSPVGHSKAIIADWKTGFIDNGHDKQMTGYAYLIWRYLGAREDITIKGVLGYLRHNYFKTMTFKAEDFHEFEHELVRNILPNPGRYVPGTQCEFCPIRHGCDARTKVARSTIDAMSYPAGLESPDTYEQAREMLTNLTPETRNLPHVGELVSQLMFRIRLAEQAVEECRSLIKDAAERVGGIPMPDGVHELAVETSERRNLDTSAAMPVLRKFLSNAKIHAAANLSITKLESAVAADAPRGMKRKQIEDLNTELDRAGAVRLSPIKRLTMKEIYDVDLVNAPKLLAAKQQAGGEGGSPGAGDSRPVDAATQPGGESSDDGHVPDRVEDAGADAADAGAGAGG